MDVAVEEGVEDAGDGGVGGEEGEEEDGGDDLRCSSIEVGVVAAAAVAECLSDLMEVPGIVQLMFQSPRKSRNCLVFDYNHRSNELEVFSLHRVHILPAQGLLH